MHLHTEAFSHRSFYTQTLLHREALTHRRFNTQAPLHADAFTHRLLYTRTLLHRRFYTQTLLHTDAFTHRCFYTQTLFTQHFYTQTPSDTHTHFCSELSYRLVMWNASVVQKTPLLSWSEWMKAGIWPNTTVEESPFYKSVAIRSRQSQIAPTVQI